MDKIDKLIEIVRTLKEEGMVVGAGGFTGAADPKGPVAGYDPVIQLDGRGKMMRRLPPEYRKLLSKGFNKRRKKRKKKN